MAEEIFLDAYFGWLRKTRFYKYLSIFSTLALVILAIIYVPRNIPFWQFETFDIINLLTSLALVSLFIERANEVILVAWRGKGQQTLLTKVSQEKKRLSASQQTASFLFSESLGEAQREYEQFSAETRSIALLTALGFGIAISIVGVRALDPLVDPAVLSDIAPFQKKIFIGADVFLTGALLGGGAHGIHKILDLFLSYVDRSRQNIKEREGAG